jgi:hypothetical protein
MEENTYNRLNRPKFLKQAEFIADNSEEKSLKELLLESEKGNFLDSNELFKSYCYEIKEILKNEEVKDSLEKFFKLEDTIESFQEDLEFKENVPSLLDFHRSFSSTALRIFWECVAGDEIDLLAHRFLDAFRIALEEELYIWQEKIH